MTNAPAPSPNKTQLVLSYQSRYFEFASVATSRIFLYIPEEINALAIFIAYIIPVHAAVMSKAAALSAPIAA